MRDSHSVYSLEILKVKIINEMTHVPDTAPMATDTPETFDLQVCSVPGSNSYAGAPHTNGVSYSPQVLVPGCTFETPAGFFIPPFAPHINATGYEYLAHRSNEGFRLLTTPTGQPAAFDRRLQEGMALYHDASIALQGRSGDPYAENRALVEGLNAFLLKIRDPRLSADELARTLVQAPLFQHTNVEGIITYLHNEAPGDPTKRLRYWQMVRAHAARALENHLNRILQLPLPGDVARLEELIVWIEDRILFPHLVENLPIRRWKVNAQNFNPYKPADLPAVLRHEKMDAFDKPYHYVEWLKKKVKEIASDGLELPLDTQLRRLGGGFEQQPNPANKGTALAHALIPQREAQAKGPSRYYLRTWIQNSDLLEYPDPKDGRIRLVSEAQLEAVIVIKGK